MIPVSQGRAGCDCVSGLWWAACVRTSLTPFLKDTSIYVRPPSLFRQGMCSLERWRRDAFNRSRSPVGPCAAPADAGGAVLKALFDHDSEVPEGAGLRSVNYGEKHCRPSAKQAVGRSSSFQDDG